MANDARSGSSTYPPSMGPGARPINQPGNGESSRTKLMQVMQARSKYEVAVEEDTLSLSYELNDAPRLYRLSFDAMPMQGLSKWWLYGGSRRARQAGVLAIDIIRGSENITQRPVTQQEAEALTYWTSKRLLYGSYATVIGTALGFYLARRGHARMKFPILSAKPLEQYNHFPLQRTPIITGRRAQTAWQLTRYMVWTQLAVLVATPIVSTVGSLRVAAGMANDSRTQGLVHALEERNQSGANPFEFPEQRQPQSRGESWGNEQDGGQDTQSDFQTYARKLEGGRTDGGDNPYIIGQGNTSTMNDSATRNRENQGQYGGYSSSQQPQRQVQSTRSSTAADSDPFFYDDASPTAGNDPDNASATASNASSGGSVWDRIRRGGPSQTRRSPQSDSARAIEARSARIAELEAESNERNAYSSEARQGGRDREQAQREFDQMLDRERQQSGSDEYDAGVRAVEQGAARNSGGGGGSAWERRKGG